MQGSKGVQLQAIISAWSPDIITGDFNGPLDLVNAKKMISRNAAAQGLTEKEKALFAKYLISHAITAEDNGYSAAFTAEQVGSTSSEGNPDWIFYNPKNLGVSAVSVLDLVGSQLFNHNGVIVTFAIVSDSD